MKTSFLAVILLLFALPGRYAFAQENVITVGLQLKPIFPVGFFGTGPVEAQDGSIGFKVSQLPGFSGGMVIRKGLTRIMSLETGISYTKRNYQLAISDSTGVRESKFGITGYEIPVSLLAYIKLSKNIYMNTSLGMSIDMFPSNIYTSDEYFKHLGLRNGLFNPALIANLGYEFRTEKSGYFYLGASYHSPIAFIYESRIKYTAPAFTRGADFRLSGNYLTIDFRYFFHEDPVKKAAKKKSTTTDKPKQ